MEIRILTCVISVGVLLALVLAEEVAPKGTFVNWSSNNKVKLDESMTFNCSFEASVSEVFSSLLEIYRKKGNEKIILAEKAILHEAAHPDNYAVSYEFGDPYNKIILIFKILKVSDVDDGKLYCGWSKGGKVLTELNVDIIVLRPLNGLQLRIDKLEPIKNDLDTQIEVKSGKHNITCIADGSNPQAKSIELFLHGTKHPDSQFSSEVIPGQLTTYRTILIAEISITSANVGNDLQCRATSEYGNTKTVTVPLKVVIEEPNVVCNDTEAHVGQRDIKIICTVDHHNSKLKSIKYKIGEVLYAPGESLDQTHYVELEERMVGLKRESELTLTLQRAEMEHFQSGIFLLAEHEDGHISRLRVNLMETKEGQSRDGNNSNLVKVSLAVLLVSLISALGRHFF